MKPISLKLIGSKGVRAGMGAEEISINLSSLPAGLIAICGTNGRGKTTILDNLQPYRIMPYKLRKSGNWSPNSFSYFDQFEGSDGLIEFIFGMGGKVYRKYILIDAERRKQEAYLYEAENIGDEWKPINDGKTGTYDAAIEKVCGSPSLFFTSVFRSQGAKNLSDYTRGDIMEIIAELLNINHIKEQGAKAGEVEKHLKSLISLDNSKLDMLRGEVSKVDELRESLAIHEESIGGNEEIISSIKKDVEAKQNELTKVEVNEAAKESDRARLKDMEAANEQDGRETSSLDSEKSDQETAFDAATNGLKEKLERSEEITAKEVSSLGDEKRDQEITFDSAINGLKEKLERSEKITANAEGIREKVKEEGGKQEALSTLKERLSREEAERDTLDSRKERISEKERGLSEIKLQLSQAKYAHDAAIQSAKTKLEHAEKEAAKLEGVDCKGDGAEWINESCRFIKDAVTARNSLESLRSELEKLSHPSAEIIDLEERLKALPEIEQESKDIAVLLDVCTANIRDVRSKIETAEAELTEIARWTKLAPELDKAEEDVKQLKVDIEAKEKEKTTALENIASKRGEIEKRMEEDAKQLKTDIEAKEKEKTNALEKIAAKRDEIEKRMSERAFGIAKLSGAIGQDTNNLRQEIQKDMDSKKESLARMEADMKTVQAEASSIKGKIDELEKKKGDMKDIEARVAGINNEIARWSLFAKACSNDGIISLEIDDSGHGIASIANELLAECYGSRYSVKIVTQSAKAKGGMKEDFDITVLDSETGESASITEKSGGQVTYVEDAIVRAICLMNIQNSERTFGSLFSDEKDGSLDEDKKLAFISVKNKAIELGSHEREFFITQTRELQERADGRIILSDEGVTVQ